MSRLAKIILLGCALLLLLATPAIRSEAQAPDRPVGAFEAANKAYETQQYSEAVKLYRALLDSGRGSPALLFNLGNAEFRQDNLGAAIASYRRAQRLAPRDAQIRANLNFARERVQAADSRFAPSSFPSPADFLRPSEPAAVAALLSWIAFALLAARQIRPELSARWGSAITATLLASAALWALALWTWRDLSQPHAVVTTEAPARYGPLEESQTAFTLPDGAEVEVLDQRDEWLQIRDTSGRSAWITTTQAELLTPPRK